MGVFGEVFTSDDPKHRPVNDSNISDALSQIGEISALKQKMEADGLFAEYLIGSGRQGFAYKLKGTNEGILRIDPAPPDPKHPLDDSLALKPLIRKTYGDFVVSIVPCRAVPKDESDQTRYEATFEDFVRLAGILERKEKSLNFTDCSPEQLSYLRGDDGELLRYEDGKPIAFIHDLNATSAVPENVPGGFGTAKAYIDDKIQNLQDWIDHPERRDDPAAYIRDFYRPYSEMSAKLPDDREFVDYLLDLFRHPPAINENDLTAPRQQTIALDRLRGELAGLSLKKDLQEQIAPRSEWEGVPTMQQSESLELVSAPAARAVQK